MMDVRVVGIQLQTALELPLCPNEVPIVEQVRQSQGSMTFGQEVIFLDGLRRRFFHLAPARMRRELAEERQKKVGTGHMGIGRVIVRFELDDLVVELNTLLQVEL